MTENVTTRTTARELPRDLVRTAQRARGVLLKPCREHDAKPGEWCWPEAAQRGVRGVCGARWARGAGALLVDPPSTGDGLSAFAAEVRQAQRDQRLRRPGGSTPLGPGHFGNRW